MGTNYYLLTPRAKKCGECGQEAEGEKEELHIGKSSAGWCFSLATHPEEGIECMEDWLPHLCNPANTIRDEYGADVTLASLMATITQRYNACPERPQDIFSRQNDCWYDEKRKILRHKVDGKHCASNGRGTWDCMIGEFS